MKTISGCKGLWVLVVTLIFGSGCASLTIDVDVYKGPMTNHEEVQIRQVAGMVKGARPLLAALRERLIDKADKIDKDKAPENQNIVDLADSKKKSLEIKKIKEELEYHESELAYVDSITNRLIKDLKTAKSYLDGAENKLNLKNNQLSSKKIEIEEPRKKLSFAQATLSDVKSEAKRAKGELEEAKYNLDAFKKQNQIDVLAVETQKLTEKQIDILEKEIENARNELKWAKEKVTLLEDEESKKQLALIDIQSKVSLTENELKFLSKEISSERAGIESPTKEEEAERNKLRYGIKEKEKELIFFNSKLRKEEATLDLVEKGLVNATEKSKTVKTSLKELESKLENQSKDKANLDIGLTQEKALDPLVEKYRDINTRKISAVTEEKNAFDNFNQVQKDLSIAQNEQKSAEQKFDELKKDHDLIKEDLSNAELKSENLKKQVDTKRNDLTVAQNALEEVKINPYRRTAKTILGIMEEYYGQDGLISLIDNYEKTSDKGGLSGCSSGECENQIKERNKLLKTLIPFSEKIRYVANFEGLQGGSGSDNSPGGFKKFKKDPELESYVRVLQAVGNSIFYQIDEISQNEKYKDKIRNKGPMEARALALSLPEYVENPVDSKDVMDQLIAALKYELISEIKINGKDSKPAKKLENAIKTAYEHRASMVQIRPALAYLRTSFPSTTLQRDANLTSQNMLLEGAFSSLPVIGNIYSYYAESDERDRAELNREIDKQYRIYTFDICSLKCYIS